VTNRVPDKRFLVPPDYSHKNTSGHNSALQPASLSFSSNDVPSLPQVLTRGWEMVHHFVGIWTAKLLMSEIPYQVFRRRNFSPNIVQKVS